MVERLKSNASQSNAKGRSLLFFSFIAILALIALFFWTNHDARTEPQSNRPGQVRSTLHLETFVLNLADGDQRSYLRVGIDLGLNSAPKRADEFNPTPHVRDILLGVLAQAKADELLTAEGKTKLKKQILQALQEQLPELGVEEVYFTELLIQR